MSCAETRALQALRPERGTADAWAFDLIRADTLERKLRPGPIPERLVAKPVSIPQLPPSRPSPLAVVERAPKTPRPGALVREEARARLLHTFAHHELQAAEIFCWAFLTFVDAPEAFRRGLLKIAEEEARHARQYVAEIERLGSSFGAHPVRDWFWERFANVRTPLEFVSLMGIGFEGGNLDHCALWAERFRAVGDERGALCQESIGRDEERHVAFAVTWFEHYAGALDFETWRQALPAPLTPTVMRGAQLNRRAREQGGLSNTFQDELDAWDRPQPGC